MLKFPKGYFEEEEIEGFIVEKDMKHVWAAQLEVYKVIENICVRHDIKMFGIWGTMLGAVRHNGYIPWDDDLDIGMMRTDYEKFWDVAINELPEGYNILQSKYEPEWDEFHGRITNGNQISVSNEWLLLYHGCPYSIGIDIFPFDYLPNDKEIRERKMNLLNLITSLYPYSWKEPGERKYESEYERGLLLLEESLDVCLNREGNISNQLRCLYDEVCKMYCDEKDDLVCVYPIYIRNNGRHVFHKCWFEKIITVNYENTTIFLPEGINPILYISYGDKFMKEKRGVAGHEYPFYKQQKILLEKNNLSKYLEVMRTFINVLSCTEDEDLRVGNNQCFVARDTILDGVKKRKIVLYALNAATILRFGPDIVFKIEKMIESIKEKSNEIMIILLEDKYFIKTLSSMYPKLVKKYDNIKKVLISELDGKVTNDMSDEYSSICDAYVGNGTVAMGSFIKEKKPIMILDTYIQ